MDGKSGAGLRQALKSGVLVPMHYECWWHFTQLVKELAHDFEAAGVQHMVHWLTPGQEKKVP